MNKTIIIASIAVIMSLTACDSKLDIKPLGKTTLDKVEDLESLLNQLPQLSCGNEVFDLELICDNTYWKWYGIPEKMSNKQSLDYAYLTYDENIDRANLEDSNYQYNSLYSRINYMNVVISKMPDAKGDDSHKAQLIAEARILRAWYHFLLVNIYAQQYDSKTAEQLGGIPYVDNTKVQEQKTKLSLSETYRRILEDCSDEVIADLHQGNVADPCRFGSDFGYGVRARVLYQMKRYEEALEYAAKALAVNGAIEDRSIIKSTSIWTLNEYSDNNYYLLYSDISNLGDFFGYIASPSLANLMSPMDYISAFHFADGSPAWADPYPTTPAGSMQCQISDIRWNVFGLRAESMYFLAAECLIRSDKIQAGLDKIDKVLEKRVMNHDKYSTMNLNEKEAMEVFQKEKRIEFMNTFENFFDKKRWNSEPEYAEDIVRDLSDVGGENYGIFTLKPNSPIWVRPFPQDAVNYNPSLTQNY